MPKTKKTSAPGGVVFSVEVRSDLDEAIDSLQQQLTETNEGINQAQREREALAVQVNRLEAELHILRGNYGDISRLLVLLERVRSAEQPAAAVRRQKPKPATPEEPSVDAKRHRGKLTPEKREKIWLLHDEGKDAKQIALALGLRPNTVLRVLRGERSADVGTKSKSAAPSQMAPARGRTIRSKNMTTEERAEAVRLAQEGKRMREIARHLGRAPSTILRRLRAERARAAQRGA